MALALREATARLELKVKGASAEWSLLLDGPFAQFHSCLPDFCQGQGQKGGAHGLKASGVSRAALRGCSAMIDQPQHF